ncbi:hypothetical protein [Deinococcus cellulosilyticus]|uniref:Uncharacterized protein n=1 Tax=Deinococcus cellulosilyticus (strain DSM 18568 / NBRC 106333 / KACC 11606 / 5516J-15) TaxID=1223518 RepID=A0A511N848_DEIC1|nr:hypothetical protein [Deinococcus cellulosilyticus]GEM48687.1 hypothetical protein DC3_43220 [Deinococcus cellulosilyticus NBRC 106333 = KACC 11606]
MSYVYSEIRATILTADGPMSLYEQIMDFNFQDGLGAMPQATLTLPRYRTIRPGVRKAYTDLIRDGDEILIEGLAVFGGINRGWETVLHGIVVNPSVKQSIQGEKSSFTTTLQAQCFGHVLQKDALAWWMWLGTAFGVQRTRAVFAAEELNTKPHQIVFNYMSKMLNLVSNWGMAGRPLGDYLGLSLSGLDAVAPMAMSFSTMEGTFWSIIKSVEDAPLHEMYVQTLPQAKLSGELTRAAPKTVGEDKAATTVIMRRAPYPYADENGKGQLGEWNALTLHRLDGLLEPIGETVAYRDSSRVKNFTMLYPMINYVNEQMLFTMGWAIANPESIRRFGYSAAKWGTHLIQTADEPSVEAFSRKLSWRVAAQFNQLDKAYYAQVQLPFSTHIRPGERILTDYPWGGPDQYQFHIQSRALTWSPTAGGRTYLTLDRGHLDQHYRDPSYWVEGLTPTKITWNKEIYPRLHDQDIPGR